MNGQIRLGHNGMATLPSWPELETVVPSVVDTMRRYLQQIACVLRPAEPAQHAVHAADAIPTGHARARL